MTKPLREDDPEPAERFPAGLLYVPVRPGPAGCTARLFRTPLGARTAVGFTSARRLAATLGAAQPWITLAEPALRALGAPLGATSVTVDPQLAAPRAGRHAPAFITLSGGRPVNGARARRRVYQPARAAALAPRAGHEGGRA